MKGKTRRKEKENNIRIELVGKRLPTNYIWHHWYGRAESHDKSIKQFQRNHHDQICI